MLEGVAAPRRHPRRRPRGLRGAARAPAGRPRRLHVRAARQRRAALRAARHRQVRQRAGLRCGVRRPRPAPGAGRRAARRRRCPRCSAALRGEGPCCLVFLDDLVFDDAGRADRALRAALEGGVAGRPANVLLWATSNRLNLTAQTHSERADDVDPAEAAGEKAALADRFGRRVRFERPNRDAYVAIALRLVRDRLGDDSRRHRGGRRALRPRRPRLLAAHRPPVRRGVPGMSASDEAKRAAAERAVAEEVRSGMALGLGTGSTASPAVEAIGRLLAEGALRDVRGVPTSEATAGARPPRRRAADDPRRDAGARRRHRRRRRDRAGPAAREGPRRGAAAREDRGRRGAALRGRRRRLEARRAARRAGADARRGHPVRPGADPPPAGRAGLRAGAADGRRRRAVHAPTRATASSTAASARSPIRRRSRRRIRAIPGVVEHGLFLASPAVAYVAGPGHVEVLAR